MSFIGSYIFGDDNTTKKSMPSISSTDIKPLIKPEVIETPKEIKLLTLVDILDLPENENKTLQFTDAFGSWNISDIGLKLTRINNNLPSIESYFCCTDNKSHFYTMMNGQKIAITYNDNLKKITIKDGGYMYSTYTNLKWI